MKSAQNGEKFSQSPLLTTKSIIYCENWAQGSILQGWVLRHEGKHIIASIRLYSFSQLQRLHLIQASFYNSAAFNAT